MLTGSRRHDTSESGSGEAKRPTALTPARGQVPPSSSPSGVASLALPALIVLAVVAGPALVLVAASTTAALAGPPPAGPALADGVVPRQGPVPLWRSAPAPEASVTETDVRPTTAVEDGRAVLTRAAEQARQQPFHGEALGVTWSGDETGVTLTHVRHTPGQGLVLVTPDRYTMTLGEDGGDLVNHEQGWLSPLPPSHAAEPDEVFDDLGRKYAVEVVDRVEMQGRPCTVLEIERRSDGSLRERLWIDRTSGVLLRRETFDGSKLLRLAVYLSLEFDTPAHTDPKPLPSSGAQAGLTQRSQEAVEVGDKGLDALEAAGWSVAEELLGGYRLTDVYAVTAGDSSPLHLVYSDGLYAVSVFQQHGTADWSSLPGGAEQVEGLEWDAYEWPGAHPRRLVWGAGGVTFTVVGDAPPDEFLAVARTLPGPDPPGLTDRLRRALHTVRSWLSGKA